jgi:hypothetical protein
VNLDTVSKVLQIVLGEGTTTTAPGVLSSWADSLLPNSFTLGETNVLTAGTTPVVVVAAPANMQTQRQVKEIRSTNTDSVTHHYTLQLFDGVDIWIVQSQTIAPGGEFVYTPDAGVTGPSGTGGATGATGAYTAVPGVTSVTVSGSTQTLTMPSTTGKYSITLNHSVTFTLNSGTNGQTVLLELIQGSGGNFTVGFDSTVQFGTDLPSFTASTTAGLVDYGVVQYSANLSKWAFLAYARGF